MTKNVATVVATKTITLIFSFVSRTIFIYLLGKEYLGIDGLFTSILNIFSLAELGIGNALIYGLYKPIAEGDDCKSQKLLTLYKRAYRVIFYSILCIGLCLLPFIKRIVNADLDALGVNIYVVFILFLLRTLSSYFLAHRQAVLVVNQLQRVVSMYQTVVLLAVYILECAILLFFHNYYLFLIIGLCGNYGTAILISRAAKKRFPELCVHSEGRLPREDIDRIKKNVYALFIRRVGGVVYASTDNIVINEFISLAMVGVYSNYVLLIGAIKTITNQAISSMTASIGNFVSTNSKKDIEQAFYLYTFIVFLIYGFCAICFISLTNRFVSLIWGEDYKLSMFALFLIVLDFLFHGIQTAINVFRDTTGLFTQGKYRGFISAIVNLIVSVILVKYMGIEGVLLGTIVSRVFVSAWYDPYILYIHFFNSSPIKYFCKLLLYIFYCFSLALIIYYLVMHFNESISGFLFTVLVTVLMSVLLIIPFIKTTECRELFVRVRQMRHK